MDKYLIFINYLINRLDAVTRHMGRSLAWLSIVMALLTFVIVVIRRFGIGSIATQELVIYLHACVFLLGTSYTLQQNRHVRVDVFYRRFTTKQQALVNVFGHLVLLIPVCIAILYSSWEFVAFSWRIQEGSQEAGGLPWVYLLKTLLVIMPAALIYQASLDSLKLLLFLFGKTSPPHDDTGATH